MIITRSISVSRLLCCSLLLSVLAVPGFSADVKTVLEGVRAKNALAKKGITDLTLVQVMKAYVSGKESPAVTTTMLKKGDRFRIETDMAGQKMLVIFDGKDFWSVNPVLGKKKMSLGEARQYGQQMNWWDTASQALKLSGTETVNGRECYRLDNTGTDLPLSRLWIDAKTSNLVQTDVRGKTVNDNARVVYSDFKTVKDDFELAYTTEMFTKGARSSTVTIKSVSVNTGLADDLFAADKVQTGPNPMDNIKGFMQGIKKN